MLENLRIPLLCIFAGASLLAVTGNASSTPRNGRAPSLRLEATSFKLRDGSSIAAEQGSFNVPEHRGDPASRRIAIKFVRFRSTSARPGPPIVYLAGGPGGSGIDAAHGPRQPLFLSLRALGDVIALDQRGTGLSNAVPPCTASSPLDPARGINEASLTDYYRGTLSTCIAEWRAAGVAVEGYNTVENADDLDDLRRALGVPKIRLWGISYGTHLALAMMRRHPEAVDRVVLASAEGLDQTVKLPKAVDAAIARIDQAVGTDLSATMRRVHERLDRKPAVLKVGDATGSLDFRMDSFALRMVAGGIAKNPKGIADLAGLYAAFDAGQEQALAPMLYGMFLKDPLVMTGMPELMDLASGISAARLDEVRREATTSLVGDATNFPMPQIAGVATGLDLGDGFRREIRSTIPVLLFSGDLDMRTPLEEQTAATAGLGRLTRIIVHNGGHDLFESDPAIADLMASFFRGEPIPRRSIRLRLPRNAPAE